MRVLIGIDASTASQHVLEEVINRPWPEETDFTVLHVADVYGLTRTSSLVHELHRQGLVLVQTAAEKLCQAGRLSKAEVLFGTPRREIAEYAKKWDADLVMVGSHGQGALARLLLGSVAHGVLRTAPCSAEIVRPRASNGSSSSARAIKVLVATDGSNFSIAALDSVASRPWPEGSEVKLISVEELPALLPNQMTASSLSAMYPASLLEELLQCARTHAKEAIENASIVLRRSSLRLVNGSSTPLGDPRLAILEAAREWRADLIVLGSHGRRGLDRLLLGSVAENIALHAHCSVEVIRAGSD